MIFESILSLFNLLLTAFLSAWSSVTAHPTCTNVQVQSHRDLWDLLVGGSIIAAVIGILGSWLHEDLRRSRLRFECRDLFREANRPSNGLHGCAIHIRNAGRTDIRNVVLFASPRDDNSKPFVFRPFVAKGFAGQSFGQSPTAEDAILHWEMIHPKDRVIVYLLWKDGLAELNPAKNDTLRISYEYGCSGRRFPWIHRVTKEWRIISPERKQTLKRLEEADISEWVKQTEARVELMRCLADREAAEGNAPASS